MQAILVCADPASDDPTSVGYIWWWQAKELAPLLDFGLQSTRCCIEGRDDGGVVNELLVRFECEASGEMAAACRHFVHIAAPNDDKIIDSQHPPGNRAEQDLALSRKYRGDVWPPAPLDAWQPLPGWEPQTKAWTVQDYAVPWTAFAPQDVRPLKRDEVEAEQARGWPPSAHVLSGLGVAPADDVAWWGSHGLLPPERWRMGGASNLVPHVAKQTSYSLTWSKRVLDGAAHGGSPWLESTLEAVREAVHSPEMWVQRNCDGYIRAFGGPYVLGQDEDKLKIVHGAPHTAFSRMISRGHSLIYTATHLTHPAAPGYNTLILALNLRSAGFYYHQDAVGELKPKAAPLVPKQPVVTTVFYVRLQSR